MKPGNRKFLGFIITAVLYTGVLIAVVVKMPQLVVDLSVFAVQASAGYMGISGLFFTGNVLEHFANKNKQAKDA